MKYGWTVFVLFSLSTGLKLRIRGEGSKEGPGAPNFGAFSPMWNLDAGAPKAAGAGPAWGGAGAGPAKTPDQIIQNHFARTPGDNRVAGLWAEFQEVCHQHFKGSPFPAETPKPNGVTLIATMNHGLCFEANKLSDFCDCRSIEIRRWGAQEPTRVFLHSFNATQWEVMDGSLCQKFKFDVKGHTFSENQDFEGAFSKCKAKNQYQTQLRSDWWAGRKAWARFYSDGKTTFEQSKMDAWSSSYVHFPVIAYLPPPQNLVTFMTGEEMAGPIGEIDSQFWCGGDVGNLCGPAKEQRNMDSVDAIYCPIGPAVAVVRDMAAALNNRNQKNSGFNPDGSHIRSGVPSAFWVMAFVPTIYGAPASDTNPMKWKMKGIGLEWTPVHSLSYTMLCQQWFPDEAPIRNETGFIR